MTTPIMGVEFANPRLPSFGVEAMTLSDLLGRVLPDHFLHPQRPAFHMLLLFGAGRGWHRLDFEAISCGPGTMIHVRPGQVQQFHPADGLEASVILFRPDFLPPERPGSEATLLENALPQGVATLRGEEFEGVSDGFASFTREYARSIRSRSGSMVLQHLLSALLLRLAALGTSREAGVGASAYPRIFLRFKRALERAFAQSLRVGDYARDLGVAEKTLGRACLAVAGIPPTRLIEGRVLLEAKRLLAYTDLPAASIAGLLGFEEPTNFAKFFRRLTGTTPIGFRNGLGSFASESHHAR